MACRWISRRFIFDSNEITEQKKLAVWESFKHWKFDMIGKKSGVTRQLASCQSCGISKSICLSNCWSEKSSTLWWMLLLHDTSSDEHKINNWSNFPAWEKLDFVQELYYIYEDNQKRKANGSNVLGRIHLNIFLLKFLCCSQR